MSKATYSPELQTMIDRAGSLTAEEAEALGKLWTTDEGLTVGEPSIALGINGGVGLPIVTNAELVTAWQRALDAAGEGGRVDEIEAAREAGRAATREIKHMDDDSYAKNGAEEAVRSAVLATGVRDLVSDDDYTVLTAAWTTVLGASAS